MIRKIAILVLLAGVLSPVFCIDTAYADDECYAVRDVCFYNDAVEPDIYYNSSGYAWWFNGLSIDLIDGDADFSNIDGTVDIGIYLINASPNYETIYYLNGSESALNSSLDSIYGEGNWNADFLITRLLVHYDYDYYFNVLVVMGLSYLGNPMPACPLFCEREISSPMTLYPDAYIDGETNDNIMIAASYRYNDPNISDDCSIYYDLFDDYHISQMSPYIYVTNRLNYDPESGYVYLVCDTVFLFNSSSIPEDTIITSAFLNIVPYAEQNLVTPDNDLVFVVSGLPSGLLPLNNSETKHLDESMHSVSYGSFNWSEAYYIVNNSEFGNWDAQKYVGVELNENGIDALNTGNFTLSIRTQKYIDMECPTSNGSTDFLFWSYDLPQNTDADMYNVYPKLSLEVYYETPGPTPTPTLSNGTLEDLTNVIPIVFACILVVTLVASLAAGFTIGSIFYLGIAAAIGIALLGVITSIIEGMW